MEKEKQDKLKAYEGSVLDQGYGVVGKRVMRDRSIKIGAKGLYCYLCVYGHEVFPKRDTVADFSFCPRFAHSKRRKLLLAFAI